MSATVEECERWRRRAEAVTITRDDWGVPHVHGKKDADAVFGLMFAQAEDDLARIERTYLAAMGRLAEAEGPPALYADLRARLYVDARDLKQRFDRSPAWLQELMIAWADGLNCYVDGRSDVRLKVLDRFEPWMALSCTEGGIFGDIGRIPIDDLERLYGDTADSDAVAVDLSFEQASGSNAFAIAPARTRDGETLLLINPHPDFYFRAEAHIRSDEGLNCYGAVTWGQFFMFQGFNDRLGWGHTTSGAKCVDEYVEAVTAIDGRLVYCHGNADRPVEAKKVELWCKGENGALERRSFTTWRTHHGPIIRRQDGKLISVALMYKPVEALCQAFLRMKAGDYDEFLKTAEFKANSIGNCVYADADGNIAFFFPQFMPKRDPRHDFTRPVDGSDPSADWQGEHGFDELPNLLNPATGWIVNANDEPFGVAGDCSPDRADFPAYIDTAGRQPRSINAGRLLAEAQGLTLDRLVALAYDDYLVVFERLIPDLLKSYDTADPQSPLKAELADPVELLRAWHYRYSADSVATSVAILWGEQLLADIDLQASGSNPELAAIFDYLLRGRSVPLLTFRALPLIFDFVLDEVGPETKLRALARSCRRMKEDFGTWRIAWGEINRFQRAPDGRFDDRAPSEPVPLTSSVWGSLASCKARRGPGTKRQYGVSGNGFVLAVAFGSRVRARAVGAGGASNDPRSSHYNDQGARFATAKLRDVYFHPDELEGHVERRYHPGARALGGAR